MVHNERRAVFSLALIMACRMLGMFMILPIFSSTANQLQFATPTLVGIGLGIYGLTQACLQLPFGALSDHIGRKKVITLGLAFFALGSAVAALSHSIYGVILGRALQGAGAVGSTILATISDLTPDENRSKAMASIGLTVGLSFSIALIMGPILNHFFGLSGIFWVTFYLSLLAMALLHSLVPTPPKLIMSIATGCRGNQIRHVLKNKQLLRLDLGIFCTHAILTATFIATPIMLTHLLELTQYQQVLLYLIVIVCSFILMLPFIIIAEKKQLIKPIFLGAICVILLCEIGFNFVQSTVTGITTVLLIFFTAFTLLEATLPSLVSKIAPLTRKGTAMGIYSTAQFLGIFAGGSLGGLLSAHFGLTGLFSFCTILAAIWLFFASSMSQPPYLTTCLFPLNPTSSMSASDIEDLLAAVHGVTEVVVMPAEGLIYVKIDQKIISKDQLRKIIDTGTLQQDFDK